MPASHLVSLKTRVDRAEYKFMLQEYQAFQAWLEEASADDLQAYDQEILLRLRQAGIDAPEPEAFSHLSEEDQAKEWRRLEGCSLEQVLRARADTWLFGKWQRKDHEHTQQT